MKELLRTNDVTKIIFARAVLSDSGIPSFELDVNISKKVKNIDQNAAAFILQGAIDYLKN